MNYLTEVYQSFIVEDDSNIGEIRRSLNKVCSNYKFSDEFACKISIITMEMASNLLKHTKYGGEILFSLSRTNINDKSVIKVIIISIDKEPGIEFIDESLYDGTSTVGSSGTGLGAIKRMSDIFDIYSKLGEGSIIVSQLFYNYFNKFDYIKSLCSFDISGICVPVRTENVSGDLWDFHKNNNGFKIVVSDGLGHGIKANEASCKVIKIFRENIKNSSLNILKTINENINDTRGASVAVIDYDAVSSNLFFSSIGNISAKILSYDNSVTLLSKAGIAGTFKNTIAEKVYSFTQDDILVVATDGISSQWHLKSFIEAKKSSALLISSIIYSNFKKIKDDVTVVAVKKIL